MRQTSFLSARVRIYAFVAGVEEEQSRTCSYNFSIHRLRTRKNHDTRCSIGSVFLSRCHHITFIIIRQLASSFAYFISSVSYKKDTRHARFCNYPCGNLLLCGIGKGFGV